MNAEIVNVGGFSARDIQGLDRWETQNYGGTGEPTFASLFPVLTTVGAATAKLRTRIVGRSVQGQIQFSAATSIASVAGTDYMALPIVLRDSSGTIIPTGVAGMGVMTNDTTNVAVGLCHLDVTTMRLYLPTQAASGNTFTLYFTYEV